MESTREGTEALQQIAEDVEREREEKGQSGFESDDDQPGDE